MVKDELYEMIVEGFNEMGGEQYCILSEAAAAEKTKSKAKGILDNVKNGVVGAWKTYCDFISSNPLNLFLVVPMITNIYNEAANPDKTITAKTPEDELQILKNYKKMMEADRKHFTSKKAKYEKMWLGTNRGMVDKVINCCTENIPKIEKKIKAKEQEIKKGGSKKISESTITFEEWLDVDFICE